MFAGSPGGGLDYLLDCNLETYEMVRKETLNSFYKLQGNLMHSLSPFTLEL